MYQPPQFRSTDPDVAARLIRENAFASLVTTDEKGLPFVSHLPMHLDERDSALFLLGHCAKPNPQWRHLKERPDALVTFLGPHSYQSPRIYPDLARVPSWNYVAVHCVVRAKLIEDDSGKEDVLKKLIGDHEPAYRQQWIDLGEEYAHKMMAGIVAFELEVRELQCKLKLNQHRPESHAALKAGYARGNEDERELAKWMDRLGIGGEQPNSGAAE